MLKVEGVGSQIRKYYTLYPNPTHVEHFLYSALLLCTLIPYIIAEQITLPGNRNSINKRNAQATGMLVGCAYAQGHEQDYHEICLKLKIISELYSTLSHE